MFCNLGQMVSTSVQSLHGPFPSFRVKPSIPSQAYQCFLIRLSATPFLHLLVSLPQKSLSSRHHRPPTDRASTLPGLDLHTCCFHQQGLPPQAIPPICWLPHSAWVSVQMSPYHRDLSRLKITGSLSLYDQYSLQSLNLLPYIFIFYFLALLTT